MVDWRLIHIGELHVLGLLLAGSHICAIRVANVFCIANVSSIATVWLRELDRVKTVSADYWDRACRLR